MCDYIVGSVNGVWMFVSEVSQAEEDAQSTAYSYPVKKVFELCRSHCLCYCSLCIAFVACEMLSF